MGDERHCELSFETLFGKMKIAIKSNEFYAKNLVSFFCKKVSCMKKMFCLRVWYRAIYSELIYFTLFYSEFKLILAGIFCVTKEGGLCLIMEAKHKQVQWVRFHSKYNYILHILSFQISDCWSTFTYFLFVWFFAILVSSMSLQPRIFSKSEERQSLKVRMTPELPEWAPKWS